MPLPSWPDTSSGAAGSDGRPVLSSVTGEAVSFDQSATVFSPTKTEDAEGGRTVTWSIVASLPCNVDKVHTPQDVVIAGASRTIITHEVLFPLTDAVLGGLISGQKRIEIDGVGAMEVIETWRTGYNTVSALRAWCVMLGPAGAGDYAGLT